MVQPYNHQDLNCNSLLWVFYVSLCIVFDNQEFYQDGTLQNFIFILERNLGV